MKDDDRRAKFRALQKRARDSLNDNRRQVTEENKNRVADPKQQEQLARRRDRAQQELDRIQAEENGEDYERQRAWHWTVQEVEDWDAKQRQKSDAKEAARNQDVDTLAERSYRRELDDLEPLTDDGGDEGDWVDHKPSKAAVDRLVKGLKAGDARRTRPKSAGENKRTNYINESNKKYDQMLSKHYDKYNAESRDQLDRGDM